MWRRLRARDWIRTSTPFPAPPPQGGASTNFATRAFGVASLRVNVQTLTFLSSLGGKSIYFTKTIRKVVPFPISEFFTVKLPL
jgi:hypothetical protein